MRSAVAVLTYRRSLTMQTTLSGLHRHCAAYPTAIFEDCGQRDDTETFLKRGRTGTLRSEYLAHEWAPVPGVDCVYPNWRVFLGQLNLGVSGNSNRALHWFMTETDADHLCLCNDDLLVDGDFVNYYARGHTDLGVGLWCFCDFTNHPSYKWTTYPVRGYGVKFLPRMTGIMISITRQLVEKVGYFDVAFGQFGEEHCDYTHRCRFAGGICLDGQDMGCLDLEHKLLRHQECETSVVGAERQRADKEAVEAMHQASQDYAWRDYHRPYRLILPRNAGGHSGAGIPIANLLNCGYRIVSDLALHS